MSISDVWSGLLSGGPTSEKPGQISTTDNTISLGPTALGLASSTFNQDALIAAQRAEWERAYGGSREGDFALHVFSKALEGLMEGIPANVEISGERSPTTFSSDIVVYVKEKSEVTMKMETARVFKFSFTGDACGVMNAPFDYTPIEACIKMGIVGNEADLADAALKIKAASS
jgi:hypothetical protein